MPIDDGDSEDPLEDVEPEIHSTQGRAWADRIGFLIGFAIPVVLAAAISRFLLGDITGDVAVNGEVVQLPPLFEVIAFSAAFVFFVWFVMWAAAGGSPPMVGRYR